MKRLILPALIAAGLLLTGCEDEVVTSSNTGAAKKKSRKKKPAKEAEKKPEEEAPPRVEFQEVDFTETDRSRDPFRSFANLFLEQAKNRVRSQLHVVAKQYAVDELKLVGIVTRIHPPRAMFVDPSGKGHVVDRGDFLGKAEIVQGGSSAADYEIHWRVDRVREADLVLVRADPANPDVPSATRVIPLRPEDALNNR